MTTDSVLQIQVIDQALVVTLNRPKALNAISRASINALQLLFSEGYKKYDNYAAVIITGAGAKAFAAGADISEFLNLDQQEGEEFARNGHEALRLIETFHRPVIAAVNGFALGGGCELAMACHIRIASDNARFGQPEVNLGLIPGYGGTQRLIQYVGKSKAMELMLTGDMLSAEDAMRLGLVSKVVEQSDLLDACFSVVRTIAGKGPLAVEQVLRSVNAYFDEGSNGFESEIANFSKLISTNDFREGAAAFMEKRKAEFKGN